jgi:hypothetical protein
MVGVRGPSRRDVIARVEIRGAAYHQLDVLHSLLKQRIEERRSKFPSRFLAKKSGDCPGFLD